MRTSDHEQVAFDGWMQQRQVFWRNDPANQVCREQGWQNGRQYPWILPSAKWEEGLWPGIRSDGPYPLQP